MEAAERAAEAMNAAAEKKAAEEAAAAEAAEEAAMEPATPATPAPSQSLLASGITPELSCFLAVDRQTLWYSSRSSRRIVTRLLAMLRRELERVKEQLASSEASEASLKEQLREVKMTDVRAAASTDYVRCLVLKLLDTRRRGALQSLPRWRRACSLARRMWRC